MAPDRELVELQTRLRELEDELDRRREAEQKLEQQFDLVKRQNISLVRKALDLSEVKRDLEDKNFELESTKAELKRQNIKLIRKSIELSDVMRELEDRNYDLQLSARDLESTLDALHDSRERFRSLVESTSDWVWEVDERGRYTYASPKVEQLLGYRPEEVLGKTPFELMTPSSAARAEQIFAEAVAAGSGIARLDNTNLHKDGSEVILETSGVPIIGSHGELLGFRGIDRDISEELTLRNELIQAKKMEAIGQLAGGVAHDFNNLLWPIIGYAELLLGKLSADDPMAEDLREIKQAALRGRDLTKQILAFSRRQVLQMNVVSLASVLTNFQGTLRRMIREDIDITCSQAGSPGFVRADVSQIEQIIVNLAVNAQDAMPTGGRIDIRISEVELGDSFVEAQPGTAEGRHVKLEFSDTGYGMDPEILKHVFEPFFTTKAKGRGTGLGLATVYGIVSQHGGHVAVDSERGRGTSFTILFPRVDGKTVRSTSEGPSEARTSQTATILLVEDDDTVREVVSRILQVRGYRVLVAATPEHCFELAESECDGLDLLLTDVVMPRMNGKELHRRLTAAVPGLKVLFMSGYPEDVIASHGVLDEATNFIQKPVVVNTLIAKIEEVLRG